MVIETSACGSKPAGTSTTPQDSTETLTGETKKSLKVLTLGHSLAVDSCHMLALIAAYVWYCTLTGVQQLEEIKLDTVPKQFFKSIKSPVDWVLTEEEKALILETVNNTLKNPMQITPSQHTQAPAQ